MQSTISPTTQASTPSFRQKTIAGLLAFFLGWAGAHWWYLGRRHGWLPLVFSLIVLGVAFARPEPLGDQIPYYLFLIPLSAGFIESVVLCLRSDEKFDARYNAGQARRSNNGWNAAILASLFLFFGMGTFMGHVVMFSLAMVEGTLVL